MNVKNSSAMLRRYRVALVVEVAAAALCAALLAPDGIAHAESYVFDCGAAGWYDSATPSRGFKGCPTGIGITPNAGPTDDIKQWQINLGAAISAPPAFDHNRVAYVGTMASSGNSFYAVDAYGTKLWSANVGGPVRAAAAVGADNVVYVTSDAGNLRALDATTGRARWISTGRGLPVYSSPVIGPDGTIYYADYGTLGVGRVFAINRDGSQRWYFDKPGNIVSSPTLSADGKTLFISDTGHALGAYDTATGTLLWFQLNVSDTGSAAYGTDRNSNPPVNTLFVTDSTGLISALNPATGEIKWQKTVNKPIHASPILNGAGEVLVVDVAGNIYDLNRNTGGQRWSRPVSGRVSSQPIVDGGGKLYIGTGGNFLFNLGNISGIAAGTKALQVVNTTSGSLGTVLWSYDTTDNAGLGGMGSPGVSAGAQSYVIGGSVVMGDTAGNLYAIGTPAGGSLLRPKWPNNAVVQAIPVLPSCTNPSTCDFTDDPIPDLIAPPTCTNPGARFTKVVTTATGCQGGSGCGIIASMKLADPSAPCGGHICGYNGDNPLLFTQAQVDAGVEQSVLTAPSDVSPNTDRRFPQGVSPAVVGGCSKTDAPATCPIDPATINTTLACALDSDCSTLGTGYRCSRVCLNAGAVVTQIDQPCTSPVQRCGKPFTKSTMLCSANALPAVTRTTPFSSTETIPASRAADWSNYPCHEVRECSEDGALLADSSPLCPGLVNCTPAAPAAMVSLPNPPTSFNSNTFFTPGAAGSANRKCVFAQPETYADNQGTTINGSRDSASGKPNNWGVTFNPRYTGRLSAKLRPLGGIDPDVGASAGFAVDARVMKHNIKILSGQADAYLKTCDLNVGFSAKLFGQDVGAVIGPNGIHRTSTGASDPCVVAGNNTRRLLSSLKGLMVDAEQIHRNLVNRPAGSAVLTPTKDMCQVAREHQITQTITDAECNSATPTKALFKKIVNAYITTYNSEFDRLVRGTFPPVFATEQAAMTSAIGLTNGGIVPKGVPLIDRGASFAVRLVNASFPIGPFTLALQIEGSGFWNLKGNLGYGMQLYPGVNPVMAPGAEANIDITPSTGFDVQMYVGVGIGIGGLAGADVGIGGFVHVVDFSAPVLVRAALDQAPPRNDGRTLHADFGGPSGPYGAKYKIPVYDWRIESALKARADLTLLSGEIDVRVRVYFLFFSKTWKKRIAKLKGWTQTIPIAETSAGEALIRVPPLNPISGLSALSGMPEISFPEIPLVTNENTAFQAATWGSNSNATLAEIERQLHACEAN